MTSYRDVWYHSSDGLRLYARDYPCRGDARHDDPTILCMHGLTRNSADFAGLAQHLSESSDILARDCVDAMRARKPDLQFAEIPRRGHAPTLNEPASRAAIDQFLCQL